MDFLYHITAVLVGVGVLFFIAWCISLSDAKKKNAIALKAIQEKFHKYRTRYEKCESILDVLFKKCAQELLRETITLFQNATLDKMVEEYSRMDAIYRRQYFSQNKLKVRISKAEDTFQKIEEILDKVYLLPREIIETKKSVYKCIFESRKLIGDIKMYTNTSKSVPNKLIRSAMEKEKIFLSAIYQVDHCTKVDWNKYLSIFDSLVVDLKTIHDNIKLLDSKKEKCLEFLKEMPEMIRKWELEKTDEDIVYNEWMVKVVDAYDGANLLLGKSDCFESVCTDWEMVYGLLFEAKSFYDQAQLTKEIHELIS